MTRCPREEELDWAAIRLQREGIPPLDADSLPAGFEDLGPLVRHAGECVRCGEILGLLYATEGAQRAAAAPCRVASTGPRILPLSPFAGIAADGASWSAEVAGVTDVADIAEEYLAAADSPDDQPTAGSREGDSLVLTLATQDHRYVVRIFPNQDGSGATAVLLGGDTSSGARVRDTEQGRAGREVAGPSLFLRVSGVDYPFDERGYARLVGFPVEEIALIVE